MKNIVEAKPGFPLSLVRIQDELSGCQDQLAGLKGTFILLESYFAREDKPLQETAVSQEEHFLALQMVSRKAVEIMSSTQDKIAEIESSLEILKNKKEK